MRIFVAVEISSIEIQKKIEKFQQDVKINAKPTRVDQIHFTLQFLGEIDEGKCNEVKNALNKITFSQFNISLNGVGGFPSLKNPRVVWVGIKKDGAKTVSYTHLTLPTKA